MNPVLEHSAFRHAVDAEDTLHAYRNHFRIFYDQGGAEATMVIGFARNGVTILEVGYLGGKGEPDRIVHSMPARAKYL